jgi:GTP cyclohydrolase I
MTTYNINEVKAAKEHRQKPQPTREEAEEAVRVLISWLGDDPMREGLLSTPKRVIDSYKDFYAGYQEDPESFLSRTFEDVGGYDDIVLLRDISVNSHCEHHMVPFYGMAHIAYIPDGKVIGISKIARVVDVYARRLQTQETMTQQIKDALDKHLQPKGVAVCISAKHECMTTRGVSKPDVATITCVLSGVFRENKKLEERFLSMIKG